MLFLCVFNIDWYLPCKDLLKVFPSFFLSRASTILLFSFLLLKDFVCISIGSGCKMRLFFDFTLLGLCRSNSSIHFCELYEVIARRILSFGDCFVALCDGTIKIFHFNVDCCKIRVEYDFILVEIYGFWVELNRFREVLFLISCVAIDFLVFCKFLTFLELLYTKNSRLTPFISINNLVSHFKTFHSLIICLLCLQCFTF